MPLINKPHDPNYGLKRGLKRNVIRRKPLRASVLPETKTYIESKHDSMSRGQVVDAAIQLYAQKRELVQVTTREKTIKLEMLETTVSQQTLSYIEFMRSAMTPGELIDAAIMLCRELAKDIQ